jgi:murein DD-endopeptidase MepM/ murein hydrolase activator NlpD
MSLMARAPFRSLRVALAGAALMTALTTGAAAAADRTEAELGMSTVELAQMQKLPSVSAASQRPAPSAPKPVGYVRPAVGRITTPFGEVGPYWKLGYHPGLDIAVRTGTPIKAMADGVVIEAESQGENSGYGHYVKIDHGNGLHTLYAHMSILQVEPGDQIAAGQVIGLSGNTGFSTGPHLHLEVRQNGVKKDPALYLGL